MADPTFTLAGFEIELEAIITAVEGGNWATARIKLIRAEAVAAKLPTNANADGATVKLAIERLDRIARLIPEAESSAARAAGRRRLIQTSTGFQRGSGSRQSG